MLAVVHFLLHTFQLLGVTGQQPAPVAALLEHIKMFPQTLAQEFPFYGLFLVSYLTPVLEVVVRLCRD